jgi:hypothetical protein
MDPLILLIGATFLIAGFVKGVTGMGLPTVAMALLSAFLSPVAAASILLLPSLITNVAQVVQGGYRSSLLRRMRFFLIATMAATTAGTSLMSNEAVPNSDLLLGSVLILYAVVALSGVSIVVSKASEPVLAPLVGVTTGVITGATGIFVIPSVPYLQALNLEPDELVQALGMSFTASTVGLWLGLMYNQVLAFDHLTVSAAAVLPAVAGMLFGRVIRSKLDVRTFRRVFLLSLLLLGLYMAAR